MGVMERRERERERRRAAIIDAAERVFFSKGAGGSTMDDVAEAAELSKGTLYLYFKSKDELHLAIVLRALGRLQEMFERAHAGHETGREKIAAIGRAYFRFCKEFPDYFNAMLQFESSSVDPRSEGYTAQCIEESNRILSLCADAVQHGVRDGTIRPDVNPMKTALSLYGLSTGLLQFMSLKGRMIRENHGVEPEDLIENFFELIETALKKGR